MKGLFYGPKVLNYVHYTVRYAQITLEVHKAICLACVQRGTINSLDSDTITIPAE